MSNALAIAAVTTTLKNLLTRIFMDANLKLDDELDNTKVTAMSPDKARTDVVNQLNLFLYQAIPSAAWRNMDMPRQVRPGETALPPLGLNLYYLLTAYGADNNDVLAHRLLGQSMSFLHDHPVLGALEIRELTQDELPNSDLHTQIERVRITLQTLNSEELFKMWTGFQSNYRISIAYEVSVVLIESLRPTRTALPVLRRGENDTGPVAQGNLLPPYPTLTNLSQFLPDNKADKSIRLNLTGFNLGGTNVKARFSNPRLAAPLEVNPTSRTSEQVNLMLPNDLAGWIAGTYTISLIVSRPDPHDPAKQLERQTNELTFALSPQITAVNPNPAAITIDAIGPKVNLTLTCLPLIQPDQRVSLLIGDQEVRPAAPFVPPTDTLNFEVRNPPRGKTPLRLRVDGLDSVVVDPLATPPAFADSQQVTINE